MEQLIGLKIHCLSDTHNKHKHFSLPGGDILIHSGDATSMGELHQIMAFLTWFAAQPYTHKIFVPGNHDWGFELNESLYRSECERLGIHLLINQGLELEGIKFWGSPCTPRFFNWAFNVDRGSFIKSIWEQIPEDTEVLITHGPPAKILDVAPYGGNVGCDDLFWRIMDTKVKLHVFGHIHPARGTQRFNDKLFVNAASLNDQYKPVQGVPWRIVRDLAGQYFVESE